MKLLKEQTKQNKQSVMQHVFSDDHRTEKQSISWTTGKERTKQDKHSAMQQEKSKGKRLNERTKIRTDPNESTPGQENKRTNERIRKISLLSGGWYVYTRKNEKNVLKGVHDSRSWSFNVSRHSDLELA